MSFNARMEGDTKHNIDQIVIELRHAVKSQDEDDDNGGANIIQILDSLVNVSKTSIGESTGFLTDDIFLTLLKHKSTNVVAKTAKAIAEIAKTDRGREKCTSIDLIKALFDLLEEDDIDILTQASRALGNICYENENGKKLIKDKDGLKFILSVLKKSVHLKDVEGASYLRHVAAGFLLNFLIDQHILQEMPLKDEMIAVICSILEIDGVAGGEATMRALLTLGVLNESDIMFLDERLTKVLVEILASDTSSEVSEMCLELLRGQAEDETAKVLLAKAGVCELLLKLLEKHGPRCTDEETRSVLKVACNLIVLIVAGDDSMNLLYDDSNGTVYKKLVEWLESSDQDLQIAAVLAMANFARTDTHCKLMVVQGVHKQLLKLLQKNNSKDADIRFQYALLSALRNLVIPVHNKPIILNDGLIEVLYPMLEIPTFPVVFKLLGTLRIVIDGQREAAISLGKMEDIIKRAVEWCNTKDHPGVKAEANRFIAWLINNSRDKDVALSIIEHGAVNCLVKMLMAERALMQNEAILGLTILSTMCLKESEDIFIEIEIGQVMYKFFEDRASDLELPIVFNALSFIDSIIKSEVLKEHIKKSGVIDVWKRTLSIGEPDHSLTEKIKALCLAMGSDLD